MAGEAVNTNPSAALSAFLSGNSANGAGIQELLKQQQELGAEAASKSYEAAQHLANVNAQTRAANLEVQTLNQQGAAMYGRLVGGANDVISTLAQQRIEGIRQQSEAYAKIQEKNSVGFFDNPIQWFINKATINQDISQYNSAEEAVKAANANIAALDRDMQNGAITNGLIVNKVTANSNAEAAAGEAAANLAKYKSDMAANLAYPLKALETVQQMNSQQFQATMSAHAAMNSDEQLSMARQKLPLELKHLRLAGEKLAGDMAGEEALRNIAASGANYALGGNVPPEALSKISALVRTPEGRAQMGAWMDYGFQIAAGKSNPALGVSAGDAAAAIKDGKAQFLIGQNEPGRSVQQDIQDRTSRIINDFEKRNQGKKLTAQEFAALYNAEVSSVPKNGRQAPVIGAFEAQASDVSKGDNNIYRGPSLLRLANYKVVADSPLFQVALKSRVEAGSTASDPGQVFTDAATAINSGKISFNQAVQDISTLYSAAMVDNNLTQNYSRIGAPEQREYNSTVRTTDVTTSGDIHNPQVVGTILNRVLAKMQSGAFLVRTPIQPKGNFQVPNMDAIRNSFGGRQ